MKISKKWIAGAIIGVLLAGVSYAVFSPKAVKATVTTDIVKRGSLTQTVDATGTVATLNKVDLSFNASGSVAVLKAKVGTSVKAGDVLASLSSGDALAELTKARALLAQKREGATSEEVAVAQRALDSAQAALALANAEAQNAVEAQAQVEATSAASVEAATHYVVTTESSTTLALAHAREDVVTGLSQAIVVVHTGMSDADAILGVENNSLNDSFERELSAFSADALITAVADYKAAKTNRAAAEQAVMALSATSSDASVTEAVTLVSEALQATSGVLLDTRIVLDNTVAGSVNLSESTLQTYKATIDASRTSVLASLATVQADVQAWDTAAQNVQTQVQAAQDDLATAQATAARDVANARANIRSTKATVLVREADVQKAQAQLDEVSAPARSVDLASLQADVKAAQARYAKSTIIAPISGVVTDVEVKLGEQVSVAQNVITIQALKNSYEIPVNISEADIAKISVGNKADVTLDAFGDDRHFMTTVETIYPAEKVIEGVVFYETKLLFDSTEDLSLIKPGMSANVTIQTASKDEALYLPQRAVLEDNGVKYVRVPNNPKDPTSFDKVTVVTGLRANDGLLEIVSGVTEGQTVILSLKQ